MGPLGRSVIVVAALAGAAAADVRVAGLAPFSEAELEAALRLRLGGDHRIEVVSGARGITISVDGATRSIRLGTERGEEAARVVALVVAAMVLDETHEAPAGRVDVVVDVEGDTGVVEVPRAPAAWRWSLGALVTPAVAASTHPGAGAMLAYERYGVAEGVRGFLAIGMTSSTVEPGPQEPTLRTIEVPVRAGAWLGDWFAVGAAVVAVPYTTSGGIGDRNVLFGAGLMARAQLVVSNGFGATALVGVDGMASSVEYRWEGETVLASGRLRPWLAVGVTWEGGP